MNATHPPLPKPATFALVETKLKQSSEFRRLSHEFDPTCAQYTAQQMGEYVEADRAARTPPTEPGDPGIPWAYYVYIPDQQHGYAVLNLDEAIDDLTNCDCQVTQLFPANFQDATTP